MNLHWLDSNAGLVWMAAVAVVMMFLVVARWWAQYQEHRAWARAWRAKAERQRARPILLPVRSIPEKQVSSRASVWRGLRWPRWQFRWPGWCRVKRVPVFGGRIKRSGRTVRCRVFWYPGMGLATRIAWYRQDGLLQDAIWVVGASRRAWRTWLWEPPVVARRPKASTVPLGFIERAVFRRSDGTLAVGTAYETPDGPATRVALFWSNGTEERYWLCGDLQEDRVEAHLSARPRLIYQAA